MVSPFLVAAGRTRRIVVGSWLAAFVNVVLVFALTGALGIYGPVISSLTAFAVVMAYQLPAAMRDADVTWRESVRRAWLPSMSIGAVLACLLLALRWLAHLTSKPATAGIIVAAPLVYWALYALVWFTAEERHLALYALRLRASRS
jgi:O-antigen/teichoic acid export membrane protein